MITPKAPAIARCSQPPSAIAEQNNPKAIRSANIVKTRCVNRVKPTSIALTNCSEIVVIIAPRVIESFAEIAALDLML